MVRLRIDPRDAVGDAELVGEQPRLGRFGVAVGTARSTDDEQLGVRVFDFGQRGDGHVDTLEWLDPADEQQYGTAVVVQAEGALRAATVAGREERVDYPGRHELDALRR